MKATAKKLLISTLTAAVMVFASGTASAADAQVTVSFGHDNNPGEPMYIGGEAWAKLVAEQGGDKIKLVHYPSGQLGSKNDVIDQMNMGEAVIAPLNATQFGDMGVPDFGIMMAPYLCGRWEEMEKLMTSKLYLDLEKKLEEKGYKVLNRNWHYGVRHTLTKNEVKHPSDIKGLRMRVPSSVPNMMMMKALGASATPIVMNEVYPALQQGTIDGLENPLTTILGGHWQEVAKYIALDGHLYDVNSMVCSMTFWNSLNKEQQDILVKTAEEASLINNKAVEEKTAEARAQLEKDGVIFTEVDHSEWAKAAESYYTFPEFSQWTPGLKDKVMDVLAK